METCSECKKIFHGVEDVELILCANCGSGASVLFLCASCKERLHSTYYCSDKCSRKRCDICRSQYEAKELVRESYGHLLLCTDCAKEMRCVD